MARIIGTKDRLRIALEKDREKLAAVQEGAASGQQELSCAERFAKNLALIKAYEAKKGV